jgi:hypothetical protein
MAYTNVYSIQCIIIYINYSLLLILQYNIKKKFTIQVHPSEYCNSLLYHLFSLTPSFKEFIIQTNRHYMYTVQYHPEHKIYNRTLKYTRISYCTFRTILFLTMNLLVPYRAIPYTVVPFNFSFCYVSLLYQIIS